MNTRLLLVPAIAVVAAAVVWKYTASPSVPPGLPAAAWRVGLGTETRQGRNYDELAPETPIRLYFHCDEPRYVYVFSHSAEDGTLLLWPSPPLESDLAQPLPPGSHVLPGKLADKELSWTTRSGIHAVTTFVAIAAREKVDELEALLPKVRQWTNRVFTDRTMLVSLPPGQTEVVGAARTTAFPSALLQRAADLAITESLPNGPMQPDARTAGVWLSSWKVVEHKKPATDEQRPPTPK